MNIVDRAKNIILTPKTEWPVIEPEATDIKTLYTSYIIILAAIPAIASFIGLAFIGNALLGNLGMGFALTSALTGYVMSLVMVFVVGFIADALAPSFGGQKNLNQAMKLTAYSLTAGWVAGIASIIPILGGLIALIGSLYGLYLFYLGAPVMMKVPQEKTIGYTVVIVIVAIVATVILGAISTMVAGAGAIGAAGIGALR